MSDVKILAIESSCDETSASVSVNGKILSNVISTQIDIHKIYGGVVPEIASRNHLINLPLVVDEAVLQAGISLSEIDCVAVTYGPGLIGALITGLSYAKALAYSLGTKFMGVNHMQAHISAVFLAGAKPPFICLVVSGGHTMVVKVCDYTSFEVMGSTRDDAAGEAFDKVARVMGLAYPGGAKLDAMAEEGDDEYLKLPLAMLKEDNYDFSFSGLKSAVLNFINSANMKGEEIDKAGICASFRKCVCEILTEKTIRAAKAEGIDTIGVCGGVACNNLLRAELKRKCEECGLSFYVPQKVLCSDNGAMVASAAYYKYLKGEFSDLLLNADASLNL